MIYNADASEIASFRDTILVVGTIDDAFLVLAPYLDALFSRGGCVAVNTNY